MTTAENITSCAICIYVLIRMGIKIHKCLICHEPNPRFHPAKNNIDAYLDIICNAPSHKIWESTSRTHNRNCNPVIGNVFVKKITIRNLYFNKVLDPERSDGNIGFTNLPTIIFFFLYLYIFFFLFMQIENFISGQIQVSIRKSVT